jgi:hypothetical protein
MAPGRGGAEVGLEHEQDDDDPKTTTSDRPQREPAGRGSTPLPAGQEVGREESTASLASSEGWSERAVAQPAGGAVDVDAHAGHEHEHEQHDRDEHEHGDHRRHRW